MNESYKNLLEVIKKRRPLIMNLGDGVLLHLFWNEEEEIYEDEMGKTSMKLLLQIAKGEVMIKGKLVELKEMI